MFKNKRVEALEARIRLLETRLDEQSQLQPGKDRHVWLIDAALARFRLQFQTLLGHFGLVIREAENPQPYVVEAEKTEGKKS